MPTALIVEDEPAANTLLSMLVQLRGYRTESAFNGREALDKVDGGRPDVVFLDLMLPDLKGYEVCQSLKNDKATALIPVVMVTASMADENRDQSYAHGADRYIAKPYTPDQIFEALDEADAWRRDESAAALRGELVFESRDVGETLRRLAHLRNLILARTPLDACSADAIGEGLRELSRRAEAWGQSGGVNEVAALDYQTLPDRLVLTLRDRAGWFRDDTPPGERWCDAVGRAGFDEVSADPAGGTLTFVKRFDPDRSESR